MVCDSFCKDIKIPLTEFGKYSTHLLCDWYIFSSNISWGLVKTCGLSGHIPDSLGIYTYKGNPRNLLYFEICEVLVHKTGICVTALWINQPLKLLIAKKCMLDAGWANQISSRFVSGDRFKNEREKEVGQKTGHHVDFRGRWSLHEERQSEADVEAEKQLLKFQILVYSSLGRRLTKPEFHRATLDACNTVLCHFQPLRVHIHASEVPL